MDHIQVLDPQIANKIAAGEVVERPASVIKELLENSIDAGASKIFIEIEDAGKTLIRITDDGQGIPKEEVPTAFLRHATSKINKIEDIYAIRSLGFRGEALASIAAVSKVVLLSKTQDETHGIKYQIEGGREIEQSAIGTNKGTSISIHELFYNTPARYKFLKSDQSENMAISDVVEKLALAHPEIAFHYKNQNRVLLQTRGDGRRDLVLYDLWGADVYKQLTFHTHDLDTLHLEAFLSKPSLTKGNRNHQILLVNGRVVRSKTVTDAVFEAYRSLLMVNRFPAWVLTLQLPPDQFDINIHPAKMEIKFQHEGLLKSKLTDIIRAGLLSTDHRPQLVQTPKQAMPSAAVVPRQQTTPQAEAVYEKTEIFASEKQNAKSHEHETIQAKEIQDADRNRQPFRLLDAMIHFAEEEHVAHAPEPQPIKTLMAMDEHEQSERSIYREARIIGAFMQAYVLLEHDHCLYLLDQHAAHERILYEAFLEAAKNRRIERQLLMLPLTKDIGIKGMRVFEKMKTYFEDLGFKAEAFGEKTLIVRETPSSLTFSEAEQILDILLESSGEDSIDTIDEFEDFAKMACKAAIKAHDPLSPQEFQKLLTDLGHCRNPQTCPHGRPIIITLTLEEIERRFRRT